MATFKYNGRKFKYKARILACDGKPLNQVIELENLKIIDAFMKKHSISYTLVFGSCLGAVRDKGFIAHDEDCDLGVTEENYKKIFDNIDDLLSMGMEIARFDERGLVSFWRNGEYIDIYCYKYRDENTYISCDIYITPKKFIDNAQYIKFYDMEISVPQDYEEYMLYEYGETWVTPIKYQEREDNAILAKARVFIKNILPKKIKIKIWHKLEKQELAKYQNKYNQYLIRENKNESTVNR